MVAAIRQFVTVGPGGLIQLRSTRLKAGAEAEVIVLVPEKSKPQSKRSKSNGARSAKSSAKVPVARMTRQVRGDIAEAKRMRKAIQQGREELIPWEQVKRELELG